MCNLKQPNSCSLLLEALKHSLRTTHVMDKQRLPGSSLLELFSQGLRNLTQLSFMDHVWTVWHVPNHFSTTLGRNNS